MKIGLGMRMGVDMGMGMDMRMGGGWGWGMGMYMITNVAAHLGTAKADLGSMQGHLASAKVKGNDKGKDKGEG